MDRKSRPIGRPPRISREAVVDAAERIVEREGLDALTMRRVAAALGVSPMALYRHVPDKDGLLTLVLDRVIVTVPNLPPSGTPRGHLLTLWQTLYDTLTAHPWLMQVLLRRQTIASPLRCLTGAIVATFAAAGQTPEQAATSYQLLWHFTIGVVTAEQARTRAAPRPQAEPGRPSGTRWDRDNTARPAVTEPVEQPAPAYAEMLALMLDGVLPRG